MPEKKAKRKLTNRAENSKFLFYIFTPKLVTYFSAEEADRTFPDSVLAWNLADVRRETGSVVSVITLTAL